MSSKVIRFQCEFCKRNFANKTYADRHESNCFYNPKTKACATCKNKTSRDTKDSGKTVAETTFDDVLDNNFDTLDYCKAKCCFLITLKFGCDLYQFNGFTPNKKKGEKHE